MSSDSGRRVSDQDTARLRQAIYDLCPKGQNGKPDIASLVQQLEGHVFGVEAGSGRSTLAKALKRDSDTPVPGQFLVVFEHVVPNSVNHLLPLYGTHGAGTRGLSASQIKTATSGLPQSCPRCQVRRRHGGEDGRPFAGLEMIPGRGDVYLVLGTSGLRIGAALERTDTGDRPRFVVKLEDYLVPDPAALPRCLTDPWSEIAADEPLPLRKLLTLPFPLLCRLWRQALASAMAKINELLDAGDVYFTFHGVWFNNEYQDQSYAYMSCVDIVELKAAIELLRANRCVVVMLVDDVFSIVARLATGPHRLFNRRNSVSGAALSVVSWRRQEFVVADHVSRALTDVTGQATAITFGIKHPRATFERLLTRPAAEVVYLVHPIPWPADEDEWESYTSEVNGIAAELRARQALTLVEAGAVDEYRFSLQHEQEQNPFAMRQRWPAPPVALLEADATPAEEAFAAHPFEDHAGIPFEGDKNANLDRLKDLLLETIHGRGRSLAVQSGGGVIGLRPFGSRTGRRSTGVWIVSRLNHDLRCIEREPATALEVRRARTVLVHPAADEVRRAALACAEACAGAIQRKGDDLVSGWTAASRDNFATWLAADAREQGEDGVIASWLKSSRAPHLLGEQILNVIVEGGFATFRDRGKRGYATWERGLRQALARAVSDALNEPGAMPDLESVTSRRAFGDAEWISAAPTPAELVDRILDVRADDVRRSGGEHGG